jgi:hypothetical protein
MEDLSGQETSCLREWLLGLDWKAVSEDPEYIEKARSDLFACAPDKIAP